MKIIVQIVSNALGIFIAQYIIPGVIFEGGQIKLILAGFILGLVNFFIKPVLKFISAPLILLTFGLFTIIINMAMLWLVDLFVQELQIKGFWAFFWATIIISAVNFFISFSTKKDK